jgi:predicted ABC-type ATPase
MTALCSVRSMTARYATARGASAEPCHEMRIALTEFKPLLEKLKLERYEFHLIYLWLQNAELAIKRVQERVRLGGHDVPKKVVQRRYERGLANFFNIYRPIADSWIMLDNSQGPSPKLIAWRNVGSPLQIVKSGPWERLRQE